jgi:hypothetical protein
MFKMGWKDFKLENLRGTIIHNSDPEAEKAYSAPTLAQYSKWMIGIKKTLTAIRAIWMLKMAMSLPYKDGVFTNIVDPDFEEFFDTYAFQYVAVTMAIEAGGQNSLPFPNNPQRNNEYGDHLDENYRYVTDCIAAFSAQMSQRCIDAFPDIYGRLNIDTHPFDGLHEWVMLHREFVGVTIQGDSDKAWKKLIKATEQKFEAEASAIKTWLTRCELAVIELIAAGTDSLAIDKVIIGNCIEKFEVFQEHTALTAKWVMRGNALQTQHKTKSFTW